MSTCMASYLHGAEQISLLGILACNACSTPYNPTASEEFRQIDPGSPFSALSGDWACPHCPAPAAQFPVRESPGAAQALNIAALNAAISALVADCKGLCNALTPRAREIIRYPLGQHEFIYNTREQPDGYKTCSLFSAMGNSKKQAQAADVAKAGIVVLFDDKNQADTDRPADTRAARQAELAEPEPPQKDFAPKRRRIIGAVTAND